MTEEAVPDESTSAPSPFSIDRSLDRRWTANFMALADLAIATTAGITLAITVDLVSDRPNSFIAMSSIALLLVHALVLLLIGGFLATVFIGAVKFGSQVAGDEKTRIYQSSRLRNRLERHLGQLPEFSNTRWNLLIAGGIIPQVTLVAATGGMDKSPFAQILMATFVLGQFRASTGKAIWALFVAGVVSAILTHISYLTLAKYWPEALFEPVYEARYFIVPGVIVAFASTVVFWVTFTLDRMPYDQNPLRGENT